MRKRTYESMVLPVPGQMQTAEKSLEYGLFPDNTPEKVKRLVDSLQSISFNLQALEKQVEVAMADYRKIGLARAQAETAEQNTNSSTTLIWWARSLS